VQMPITVDNTGDTSGRLIELPSELVAIVVAMTTFDGGVPTGDHREKLRR